MVRDQPITMDSPSVIDVVDGLRGLAILAVLFHHILSIDVIRHVPYLFGQGWLGVNLFFMLSGFVLYRPYRLAERAFHSWADVRHFYIRRFFRLYPLLFVSGLVSILIQGVTGEHIWQLCQILTTSWLFTATEIGPSLNWVLWSLQVEIWFSLLFPLAVWAIQRFSYLTTGAVVAVGALSVRLVGAWWYPSQAGLVTPNPLLNSFAGRFDDFFLGILLCHAFSDETLRRRYGAFPFVWIGAGAAIASIVGWDLVRDGYVTAWAAPLLFNLFQAGMFFLVLAALTGMFPLTNLCRLWWLRVHGAMCYSLYIWHGALFGLFPRVWIYLCFVYLVSILSYRYIEFGHVHNLKNLFRLSPKPRTVLTKNAVCPNPQ